MSESKLGKVKVYLRPRPTADEPEQTTRHVEILDGTSCRVVGLSEPIEFDEIITAQSNVYERCCHDLPQHLCDGYHSTLITYGPSQSGKTYNLFDEDGGIIKPLITNLFEQLHAQQFTECLIQCSVAEVYRETLRDLLGRPNDPSSAEARIYRGALLGCVTLSCVSADDVFQILRRAHAARTVAHDDDKRHSTKSTLVLQLTLQTAAQGSGQRRRSRLLMVDCASNQYTVDDGSIVQSEAMSALHSYVRERLDAQQMTQQHINGPTLSRDNVGKLPLVGQLLLYSLGSNCLTSVILCVSPQEEGSRQTLLFGKDCRSLVNEARPNIHHAWQDCIEFQSAAEDKIEKMESVIRALADECVRLRSKGGSFLVNKQLWTMISEVTATGKDGRALDFIVENRSEHDHKVETMKLRSELRRAEDERDKALARAAKAKADLQSMKEQAIALNNQYREQRIELETLRTENVALKQRKLEVEHNLRTSLFRESEAVVFLRQFRKFYSRLLHKMAKEGSGDIRSIIREIPGAPDMEHMVDIDRMMVHSGLLEEDEVGKDNAPKDYRPSRAALQRSSRAVADAEILLRDETGGEGTVSGISGVELSIVTRPETPEKTEARQRIFQTPSGRYIAMREQELERELLQMSEKFIATQEELEAEKAKVNALTTTDTANTALRAVQELKSAQDKLKKKEKDWQAVILKMNELHLSSKDARDKVDNRDQHVIYLEATLAESQRQHAKLLASIRESNEDESMECTDLPEQVDGRLVPLWQYEEAGASPPALSSRFVIPFSACSDDRLESAKRRLSDNRSESWIDLYFKPSRDDTAAASILDQDDSAARSTTKGGAGSKIDSLLFMDDDANKAPRSPSTEASAIGELSTSNHYSNLVDAYQSATTAISTVVSTEPRVSDDLELSQATSPQSFSQPSSSTQTGPVTESNNAPFDAPFIKDKVADKPKPPTNSIIERLKAKAEAAASKEADADDGVPEWMKKFKKIGAKNANEEVLETQGAAGVREFGRTPWEALKLHDRKTTPAAELFSQQKVKWTPRVKHGSDSDSDDDRYPGYSPYIGGAPVTLPSDDESDGESDDQVSKGEGQNVDGVRSLVSPSHPIQRSRESDSDSDSSEDAPKERSPLPPKVTTEQSHSSVVSENASETRVGSKAESDSSDDEAKRRNDATKSSATSDSDSDDSEESKAKPALNKQPTSIPPNSKHDSDSDSDSSDDSGRKRPQAPPPPVLSPRASGSKGSDSDSSEESQPTSSSRPFRQSVPTKDDSDDSDSESSDDSKRKTRQTRMPSSTPSKKEPESDSDSSDDSKPTKPPQPAGKARDNVKADDSDSDSSEDSKLSKPSVAPPVTPPVSQTVAPKHDSESDSDSSDDSKAKSSQPLRAIAPPTSVTRKPANTDSDSDSSDDSRPSKIASTAPKQSIAAVDKREQEEDDGFGGWSKPAVHTSIGRGKPKPTGDDSDSDDSSRQSPVRTTSSTLSRSVLTKKAPSDGDAKDKQKFVIVNGKLVKSDSRSDLMADSGAADTKPKRQKSGKKSEGSGSKKAASAAKPAFVIVDGKLVKTDGGGGDKKGSKKKAGAKDKKKKGKAS